MQLQFGQQSFDVSTRALTLLSLQPTDSLEAIQVDTADAPHVLELDATGAEGESLESVLHLLGQMQAFNGPISVRTARSDVAAASLRHGARVAHNPDGLADPAYLRVIEEADASLILSGPATTQNPVAFLSERVGWAQARGIPKNRLVVVASDTANVAALSGIATVMFDGGRNPSARGPAAQGAHTVAVRNGARLVARSVADNDVRATRRTIDTVSELLERRETGAPETKSGT